MRPFGNGIASLPVVLPRNLLISMFLLHQKKACEVEKRPSKFCDLVIASGLVFSIDYTNRATLALFILPRSLEQL